jgi:hypothetical protein
MRSLLNKKKAGAARPEGHAWHPDFRNVSRLPDTKTVRTKFFVNVIAIAVTVALSLYIALHELDYSALKSDLEAVEADIEVKQPLSTKAVAAFKVFQAEEKAFNEAYGVVKDPLSFPDLLMQLGSLLPRNVRIERVNFAGRDSSLTVSGSVRGLDAAASDVASEFVKMLQADESLKEMFAAITLTNLGRNVAEGNMSFELNFVPKK